MSPKSIKPLKWFLIPPCEGVVKNLPAEAGDTGDAVQSLGREYPLEKEMATHSSIPAWKIPWTEEPGRLQFMGSQRVGHDWATSLSLSLFFLNEAHSLVELQKVIKLSYPNMWNYNCVSAWKKGVHEGMRADSRGIWLMGGQRFPCNNWAEIEGQGGANL